MDKDYVLKTDGVGDKPEQFPLDEIIDEDERVARGYVTVQIKDSQGEIIPVKGMSGLKRAMNKWMDRGGIISDTHTNRIVGKGLNWKDAIHPKSKKPAILIDYKIHKDYSIDNQVWDEIKSGKRKGLSFGGRALDEPTIKRDKEGGGIVRELGNFEAYEMASVQDPANKFAENTHVNFLAKSNLEKENVVMSKEDFDKAYKFGSQLLEDMQKGYTVKDIKKPFGGFENFDACTSTQQEKGHTEDSAKRICGWLKHRTEKSWMENKQEKEEDKSKSLNKLKSIEKKLDIINKIFKYNKEKKKTLYKVIELPQGHGKVLEAEFPDGERQLIKLSEIEKQDDNRPDKEWFDKCVSTSEKNPDVDDPAALCGWIWHNQKDKFKGKKEDKIEDAIRNAVETFDDSIKSDVKKSSYYEDKFKQFGDSPEAVLWKNEDVQKKRFEAMEKVFDGNKSVEVLDAGCGLGHLYKHLEDKGYQLKYMGIDTNKDFIDTAKDKKINVMRMDILDFNKMEVQKWDYILASGIYNLKDSGNWKYGMSTLFRKCRKGLAINFLTKATDGAYRGFSEKEVEGIAKSMGAEVEIIKGYLDNDVTFILRKIPLKSKSLNRSRIIKNIKSLKRVISMEKTNKQEDNSEEKKPEEEKEKQGDGVEQRVAALEAKVDQILESVSGNANMSKQEEEDKKPEEEKTKQEEEDKKPEEEKKMEDKDPKEEDKKKEEGEPKPGEGEEKLPKAPAGETNETASPEGDKVNMLEKQVGELTKRLEEALKSGDIIKSRTPRTGHDIAKRKKEKENTTALDMIKKVRSGEMSNADMNRHIKGMVAKNDDEAMKAFFDDIHSKEVA